MSFCFVYSRGQDEVEPAAAVGDIFCANSALRVAHNPFDNGETQAISLASLAAQGAQHWFE